MVLKQKSQNQKRLFFYGGITKVINILTSLLFLHIGNAYSESTRAPVALKPYKARYEVKGVNYLMGSATYEVRRIDDSYVLNMNVNLLYKDSHDQLFQTYKCQFSAVESKQDDGAHYNFHRTIQVGSDDVPLLTQHGKAFSPNSNKPGWFSVSLDYDDESDEDEDDSYTKENTEEESQKNPGCVPPEEKQHPLPTDTYFPLGALSHVLKQGKNFVLFDGLQAKPKAVNVVVKEVKLESGPGYKITMTEVVEKTEENAKSSPTTLPSQVVQIVRANGVVENSFYRLPGGKVCEFQLAELEMLP